MSITKQKVPMLDLQAQYAPIREEVLEAMTQVFDSKQFIQGPKVVELEQKIAKYSGVDHAIGVSSGTDALILALMSLGISTGDEVITSPFTFFATAGSISRVGATPVFVDIDPDSYNIDPSKIEAVITPKTKAIMPVHLFGQMADMKPILEIAKANKLHVIEDAAQAIGSEQTIDGKTYKAGSLGDMGCFSFFPSKNLGCCGDGGMITTNNVELAERARCLRVHGAKKKYFHDHIGGNFRLDPLQAAVLSVKLDYLDAQHEGRRKNAEYYNQSINSAKTPFIQDHNRTIYNQYTIRSTKRDALQTALSNAEIGNAIYYPVPLNEQPCFAYLGQQGDCPEAEAAAKEVISIPVYPELTMDQKDYISSVINSAV